MRTFTDAELLEIAKRKAVTADECDAWAEKWQRYCTASHLLSRERLRYAYMAATCRRQAELLRKN